MDDLNAKIDILQTQQYALQTMENFDRLRGFLEATEQFGKVIDVYCKVHESAAFFSGKHFHTGNILSVAHLFSSS